MSNCVDFVCVDVLETGVDDFVSFESGHHDVKDPEADEDTAGNGLESLGTAQFTTDGRITTDHKNSDGNTGFDTEEGDRETQAENI